MPQRQHACHAPSSTAISRRPSCDTSIREILLRVSKSSVTDLCLQGAGRTGGISSPHPHTGRASPANGHSLHKVEDGDAVADGRDEFVAIRREGEVGALVHGAAQVGEGEAQAHGGKPVSPKPFGVFGDKGATNAAVVRSCVGLWCRVRATTR